MDLHIILITIIVLILVILVAHGLWSSRREKSQLFKSANTFTYDSRTKEPEPSGQSDYLNTSASMHTHTLDDTSPQLVADKPAQPAAAIPVEQAVNNIRITLPKQNAAQPTPSIHAPLDAIDTNQPVESLSRSALLNRTIADLEQEIDSEEGINTSSDILRKELAWVTQQRKITLSEPIIEDPTQATPTTAAETVRAQLNPQPQAQLSSTTVRNTESEKPTTLLLYIVAPDQQRFQGNQVVQSLENLGFLFGQHRLYHRHLDLDSNSPILFSAANMMNPGIFDLDHIADFHTVGLVLFMNLPSPGNDLANFRLLLRAAQTLAEQLGGQVLNDKRQPFDEPSKARYLSLIQ